MAKATKNQHSAIIQAHDDGDEMATLQLKDIAEENGEELAFEPLQRGDRIVIYTATHYYEGRLRGEDHEVYVLDQVTQVYSTGALKSFYEGTAEYCETVKPDLIFRIRKGGVIAVSNWPLKTGPKVKSGNRDD